MVDVYFKHTHYDDPDLRQIVFDMMDAMGGGALFSGARVVLKPNFLLAARPEKGITTHPKIVRYVAEFVIDKGGKPIISDNPPMGSLEKTLSEGGYIEALSGLDVAFRPFRESAKVDIGAPFGTIDIAREVLTADAVINLAKLKTHAQMLLTLGVQNMFGCLIGPKKSEWLQKAGMDRALFARLLVQICEAIKPAMTLIDGILALEGQGPGRSGRPKALNLLAGSRSAIAADMAISSVLGLDSRALSIIKAAEELHVMPRDIHVQGDFHILSDFSFPEIPPMAVGPAFLSGFSRRFVLQRPVADNQRCNLCGDCWRYCPVKAIERHIKGIRYHYHTCIRCYSCLGICPHGAITSKTPFLGRILTVS